MADKTNRYNSPSAFLAIPAVAIIGIFMFVPLLISLVYSFMTPSVYGGVEAPWSIDSYVRMLFSRDLDDSLLFDPIYLGIVWRSLVLAVATTLLCLVFAAPFAWYIASRPKRQRQILLLLVTIPFWTNLLIRTYCWVLLLRDEGLFNHMLQTLGITSAPITFLYSDTSVLLGLVYSFLPFMVLPIYSTLEKIDEGTVEAAYDLYAGRMVIFRKIVWPLAKPGVAAGSILVFAPALGSFLAPDLIGGGRKLMIGSLIQQQFTSSRDWAFGSALSMILMAFVLGSLMLSASWQSKRQKYNVEG